MENKILFTETQQFRQWWVWLLMILLNGLFLYGIYQQVVLQIPFGTNPTSNEGLYIGFAIILTLTLLFWVMKLQTIVKEDGIYVKFFPFHFRYKKYAWDNLSKVYVREYSPITEYGGWGIRFGLFGKGNAYNVKGNQGLQLEIPGKTNLLIGTQQPEVLKAILTQLEQYKT